MPSASSWLEFNDYINWHWAKLKPYDDRFLGSLNGMLFGAIFYVVMVAALSFAMFDRRKRNKPFSFKGASIVHNFIMTVYSLWAFIGVATQFFDNWKVLLG